MNADWTSPDGTIRLWNRDCLDVLPGLEGVDAVVTDPPYGLGDRMRAGDGNEWSKGFTDAPEWDSSTIEGLPELIAGFSRAIVWGGNYYELPPQRGWLIWDKKQEHTSGHAELAWTNLDQPIRTFRLSRVEAYSRMNKQHPTQKPVSLLEWCVGFIPDGATVADCCMGSGTTGIACYRTRRPFVGIEKNAACFATAVKRFEEELARFPLLDGVA
jgi:site-specific DNA-methyltransferase (adenine-specific)